MPRPRVPSAGSYPAASISGAVDVKPTAFRSAARMADADVVSGLPGSSSALVAVRTNGAISEYQPPDATPRPSTVSGASVWSAAKVTVGLVSSLNGRGTACTGTPPKVTDTRSGASVAKASTWALVASKASTRPEPTRSGPKTGPVRPSPLYTSWVAVFITAALICSGLPSGG